jgi:hypothetical protein
VIPTNGEIFPMSTTSSDYTLVECPFCGKKDNITFPKEASGHMSTFTTPITQVSSMFKTNVEEIEWVPGHSGAIHYWNKLIGILPNKNNSRYWTAALQCSNCTTIFEIFLNERGETPQKIWPFLFSKIRYTKELPLIGRIKNSRRPYLMALLFTLFFGFFTSLPYIFGGSLDLLLTDVTHWIILVIVGLLMLTLTFHLRVVEEIRFSWRKLVINQNPNQSKAIIEDSWIFWSNFTQARFQGSMHKITQPITSGIVSVLFFIIIGGIQLGSEVPLLTSTEQSISLINSNYTSWGAFIGQLFFYGTVAFLVGVVFWVSNDVSPMVINTFTNFPLKINLFEEGSGMTAISKVAITASLALATVGLLPAAFALVSVLNWAPLFISSWISPWLYLYLVFVFLFAFYVVDISWVRLFGISMLAIFITSILLDQPLREYLVNIPIADIVSLTALGVLIIISFIISIVPLWIAIRKEKTTILYQLNTKLSNIIRVMIRTTDPSIRLENIADLEIVGLLEMKKSLENVRGLPFSSFQAFRVISLAFGPLASYIMAVVVENYLNLF